MRSPINCFKGVIAPKSNKQWSRLMDLMKEDGIIIEGTITKMFIGCEE